MGEGRPAGGGNPRPHRLGVLMYDREFTVMPRDMERRLRLMLRSRGGETMAGLLVKMAEARSEELGMCASS